MNSKLSFSHSSVVLDLQSDNRKQRHVLESTTVFPVKDSAPRASTFLTQPTRAAQSRWKLSPDEEEGSTSTSLLSSPPPPLPPPPPVPTKSTSRKSRDSSRTLSQMSRWQSFGVSGSCNFHPPTFAGIYVLFEGCVRKDGVTEPSIAECGMTLFSKLITFTISLIVST